MTKKQKLELTWIGKDQRPRLEPRILLEDDTKSYHAEKRVTDHDLFDNKLIFGDNLLALKALEQEYAGKVKCVFIDPPYNTGSAFTHYDDGLEHSIWLGLMRDRLEILRNLLSEDGSIWITIDDNECHYLKVLCDEVFGRSCFISDVVWRTSDNSNNNVTKFSLDHNDVLIYAKEPDWSPKFLNDMNKRKHFKNPDNDPRGAWFDGNPVNNPGLRTNLQFDIVTPKGNKIKHPPNGWRWSRETIEEKMKTGEIRYSPDYTRLIRRTYLADMEGLPPSTLWTDLEETGHNRQAKYELKNLFPDVKVTDLFGTPKPERLLQKILLLATNPGDLVLDSFAGSGTTGAVAHKMGRRWIMIELGEHCHTHIIPRLKKVIDGEDKGGITEAVGWKGGGGFRYYALAPSLISMDKYGQAVINKDYDPAMLTQAMCKLMGFTYAPSETIYWQQGHSTETDFIYVTTQTLDQAQLAALSEEVGDKRSLLICCSAFRGKADAFENLTLRKIPRAVLTKCEWGHDDYSLNVQNLPLAEEEQVDIPTPRKEKAKARAKAKSKEPSLFGDEEA
ncbi:MAG: site-specific DNA-methyltransferase [Alphaproteobacteria bacterium]|nr:MAG: site-specific DNA-methyltransferase [Alphaproteobacteria bacterium]